MLQVSKGGYRTSSTAITTFSDNYREPGFNQLEPLVFDFPEADRIYILIRKRSDSIGNSFEVIDKEDFIPIVVDSTNNESVPASMQLVSYDGFGIDDPYSSTLLLVITNCFDINFPSSRVKSMDCFIQDQNDFIRFRVRVGDSGKAFHYLVIDNNNFSNRSTYSISGLEAVVKVGGATDVYMLFSPYAYLTESFNNDFDFSYPLESVYYTRQKTFNDEGFYFSIDSTNNPSFLDNLGLVNVPGYDKACVLLVDKHIYQYLKLLRSEAYIKIKVTGKISGSVDYFKVYLVQ